MLEAFAILTGVGAIILYTHKIILPLVTLEMRQTRIEVVAAINRHGSAFGTNGMRNVGVQGSPLR
jgi:hypothetical protein